MRSITFNVNSLIMEAAQRIDEWQWIRGVVPSTTAIHRYSGRNVALDDPIFQAPRAGRVLSAVDGRSTIEEIIDESCVSRFEVCKVVALLLEAGALEPVPAAEIQAAATEALESGNVVDARKFLTRVVEMQADTPQMHAELAGLLESDREFAKAAFHYRVFAEVRLDEGAPREAFDVYQRIHEFLPTDLSAVDRMVEVLSAHPDEFDSSLRATTIERGSQAAKLHADLGLPSRAIQTLLRLVSLEPHDAGLRRRLIDVYVATGMTGEAVAEFEALAESALANGDGEAAEAAYRELLSLDRSRDDIQKRLGRLAAKRARRRLNTKRLVRGVLAAAVVAALGAAGWHGWREYTTVRTRANTQGLSLLASVGEQHASTESALNAEIAALSGVVGDPDAVRERAEARSADTDAELGTRVGQAVQAYLSVVQQHEGTEAAEEAAAAAAALREKNATLADLRARCQVTVTDHARVLLLRAERLAPAGTSTADLHRAYADALRFARHGADYLSTEEGRRLVDWEKSLRQNLDAFEETKRVIAELVEGGDVDGAFDRGVAFLTDFPPDDLAQQVGLPVHVTSSPTGAIVIVNGEEQGFTDGHVLMSPRRDNEIVVKLAGHEPHVETIPAVRENDPRALATKVRRQLPIVLSKSVAFQSPTLAGQLSALAIHGERVLVGTRGPRTEVLRLDQGQLDRPLTMSNPGGTVVAPVAFGSVVAVVGVDGTVGFFDANSGSPMGTVSVDSQVWSQPLLAGSRLLIADLDGRVTAVDMNRRAVAWQQPQGRATGAPVRADLVVADGLVYAAGTDGRVAVIDVSTGALRDTLGGDSDGSVGHVLGVAATHRLVVAVTDNGHLLRIQRNAGRNMPPIPLGMTPRGGPIVSGETAFVVGRNGRVRCVSLNSGRIVAQRDLGADVLAPPTLSNGLLLVPDVAGRLIALQLSGDRLEQVWQHQLDLRMGEPVAIVTTPLVNGDRILFGASDGRIHAISR